MSGKESRFFPARNLCPIARKTHVFQSRSITYVVGESCPKSRWVLIGWRSARASGGMTLPSCVGTARTHSLPYSKNSLTISRQIPSHLINVSALTRRCTLAVTQKGTCCV